VKKEKKKKRQKNQLTPRSCTGQQQGEKDRRGGKVRTKRFQIGRRAGEKRKVGSKIVNSGKKADHVKSTRARKRCQFPMWQVRKTPRNKEKGGYLVGKKKRRRAWARTSKGHGSTDYGRGGEEANQHPR